MQSLYIYLAGMSSARRVIKQESQCQEKDEEEDSNPRFAFFVTHEVRDRYLPVCTMAIIELRRSSQRRRPDSSVVFQVVFIAYL